MRRLEPEFMSAFRCTASACSDTCCAGWEVEIDEETAGFYRQVPGVFGARLRGELRTEEDETYFALTEKRRCPFLNGDNLCEIYQQLGEDALCDICTEHPRFYSWFGDYTEAGLGLCCEEAERLLFADDKPLRFVLHTDVGETEEEEDPWLARVLAVRKEAFAILQDRSRRLWERLRRCRDFFVRLQTALDGCAPAEEPPFDEAQAERLLTFFEGLECLDERWRGILAGAKKRLPAIFACGLACLQKERGREYEWEHLAVYFLYRYLPEAVYDQDFLTRVDFMRVSLAVLGILAADAALAGGYTPQIRDDLVRLYSREIEYCPENMETIYEALRAEREALPQNERIQ